MNKIIGHRSCPICQGALYVPAQDAECCDSSESVEAVCGRCGQYRERFALVEVPVEDPRANWLWQRGFGGIAGRTIAAYRVRKAPIEKAYSLSEVTVDGGVIVRDSITVTIDTVAATTTIEERGNSEKVPRRLTPRDVRRRLGLTDTNGQTPGGGGQ